MKVKRCKKPPPPCPPLRRGRDGTRGAKKSRHRESGHLSKERAALSGGREAANQTRASQSGSHWMVACEKPGLVFQTTLRQSLSQACRVSSHRRPRRSARGGETPFRLSGRGESNVTGAKVAAPSDVLSGQPAEGPRSAKYHHV